MRAVLVARLCLRQCPRLAEGLKGRWCRAKRLGRGRESCQSPVPGPRRGSPAPCANGCSAAWSISGNTSTATPCLWWPCPWTGPACGVPTTTTNPPSPVTSHNPTSLSTSTSLSTAPRRAEPTPARYLCSQCPASFTLKSNADRHEKTIHFKKKLMQCVYCLKHFRDRTDLHRHLSSVHSKERGHTCPACAKAFSTQKNLATHVKVCCQVGSVPGAVLGGGTGMEMSQGGVMDSLWRLSQEMKVDQHNLSINVENWGTHSYPSVSSVSSLSVVRSCQKRSVASLHWEGKNFFLFLKII